MPNIHLDNDELATVIAALRTYQAAGYGDPANRPDAIHDIAADESVTTSLDDAAIDRLIEDNLNADRPGRTLYGLMQEGGSSCEGYLHLHDSEHEASEDRRSCWEDGAYQTTPVFTVEVDHAERVSLTQLIEVAEYAARRDYGD